MFVLVCVILSVIQAFQHSCNYSSLNYCMITRFIRFMKKITNVNFMGIKIVLFKSESNRIFFARTYRVTLDSVNSFVREFKLNCPAPSRKNSDRNSDLAYRSCNRVYSNRAHWKKSLGSESVLISHPLCRTDPSSFPF